MAESDKDAVAPKGGKEAEPAAVGGKRPKPQWPSGDGVEWVRRSL